MLVLEYFDCAYEYEHELRMSASVPCRSMFAASRP
jgi:hypothetical protein